MRPLVLKIYYNGQDHTSCLAFEARLAADGILRYKCMSPASRAIARSERQQRRNLASEQGLKHESKDPDQIPCQQSTNNTIIMQEVVRAGHGIPSFRTHKEWWKWWRNHPHRRLESAAMIKGLGNVIR